MAAPAAACAVLLVLHMCDNLLNAMVNPIFICAIGGLCALGTRATQPRPAAARLPGTAGAQPQQPMAARRPTAPSADAAAAARARGPACGRALARRRGSCNP